MAGIDMTSSSPRVPRLSTRRLVRDINKQVAKDEATLGKEIDNMEDTKPLNVSQKAITPIFPTGVDKASIWGGLADAYQQRADYDWQSMLSSQREALQKERTSNAKMAQFAALGNVLRQIVQPLGWAAGGAVGQPQRYDEREYINAFNRAMKLDQDLRNIDYTSNNYNFQRAQQQLQHARNMAQIEARNRMLRKDEATMSPEEKYLRRMESAYDIWQEGKNNWHAGAPKAADDFYTHLELNGGEEWFGPREGWLAKPRAAQFANQENEKEQGVEGKTGDGAGGKTGDEIVPPKNEKVKYDSRDINKDGKVSIGERYNAWRAKRDEEKKASGSKKGESAVSQQGHKSTVSGKRPAASSVKQAPSESTSTKSVVVPAVKIETPQDKAAKWNGVAKKKK